MVRRLSMDILILSYLYHTGIHSRVLQQRFGGWRDYKENARSKLYFHPSQVRQKYTWYYEIASLWAISASCLMALAAMGMAPASEASSAIGLNVKGSSTLSTSSSSAPPLAGAGGAEGSGAGGAGSRADSAWGKNIWNEFREVWIRKRLEFVRETVENCLQHEYCVWSKFRNLFRTPRDEWLEETNDHPFLVCFCFCWIWWSFVSSCIVHLC